MKRGGKINKKDKIEWALLIIFFLFFSVCCFFVATESVLILNTPEKITLEYQGEFQFRRIKRRHGVEYEFILDNGDKISVDYDHVINKEFVNNNGELVFSYSKWIDFRNKHSGLSIVSLDGEEFLNKSTIKKDLKSAIIPFYLISFLLLIWSSFLIFLPYSIEIISAIKRRQKMKEIKKKKQLKQKQSINPSKKSSQKKAK